MNLLVVGVSYRTAPVSLLERVAVSAAELPHLLAGLLTRPHVGEAVVVSTCNRVEVYAGVTAFHGALAEVGAVLAERAGLPLAELAEHLYVRYDADAVRHVFTVAAGLDSMVVGEAQILGQLRDAYTAARDAETPGRLLHELMQQALRVGKRAHAETGIDHTGQSVVTAALALGEERVGPLAGRPALVVGAGAMGALSLATLQRADIGPRYVANRSAARAARLAEAYDARPVAPDELAAALPTVDLVISATAAIGHVLDRDLLATVSAERAGRPLLVLDLAVPRDVDPAAADVPGVTLVDIEQLAGAVTGEVVAEQIEAAEAIVAGEVEAFLRWLRGAEVVPTVAALRARADDVVTAELRRLAQRRPDLSDEQRADVARTVHRVVQRLLHQPTVRVRELATEPGGDRYAALLRELFALDITDTVDADAAAQATTLAVDVDPGTGDAAGGVSYREAVDGGGIVADHRHEAEGGVR